jgi:RNA polymerase sigma-70 factor (ECF subfamily)
VEPGEAVESAGPIGAGGIEELYRRERDRVLRLCASILGNHHEAEEAVQETFLRASRYLESIRDNPSGYLSVIARRVCAEMLRGARYTLPLESAEGSAGAAGPDVAESWVMGEVLARVWRRLPANDRRLIFGSYAGYSYDEMAASTGLSPKSVSVGLHRARMRARALIDDLKTALPPLPGRLYLRRLLQGASEQVRPGQARVAEAPALACAILGLALFAGALNPPGLRPSRPAPSRLGAIDQSGRGTLVAGTHRPREQGLASIAGDLAHSVPDSQGPLPAPAPPSMALPTRLVPPSNEDILVSPQSQWTTPLDLERLPGLAGDLAVAELTRCFECSGASSDPLLLSGDGGNTWQLRQTTGLYSNYFSILFPQNGAPRRFYAQDIVSQRVLLTEDEGQSFLPVPGAGLYLVPYLTAPAGWPDDLLAASTGLVGIDGTTPRLEARFPLGMQATGPPVVVPGASGSEALVPVGPAYPWLGLPFTQRAPTHLEACTPAACRSLPDIPDALDGGSPLLIPSGASMYSLVPSPDYATDGTILLVNRGLWLSTDWARSFRVLGSDPDSAAIVIHAGRPRLAVWRGATPQYSDDLGATWLAARMASDIPQLSALPVRTVALSPRRMIAAAERSDSMTGLALCSLDQGQSWELCPPATAAERG